MQHHRLSEGDVQKATRRLQHPCQGREISTLLLKTSNNSGAGCAHAYLLHFWLANSDDHHSCLFFRYYERAFICRASISMLIFEHTVSNAWFAVGKLRHLCCKATSKYALQAAGTPSRGHDPETRRQVQIERGSSSRQAHIVPHAERFAFLSSPLHKSAARMNPYYRTEQVLTGRATGKRLAGDCSHAS